jgi:hypothetical protein
MAITLRNKTIEEKIRRLARRKGIGPSAVIAEAIDRELASVEREADQKLRDLRAIRSQMTTPSDKEREDFWSELDHVNEELFTAAPSPRRSKRVK